MGKVKVCELNEVREVLEYLVGDFVVGEVNSDHPPRCCFIAATPDSRPVTRIRTGRVPVCVFSLVNKRLIVEV